MVTKPRKNYLSWDECFMQMSHIIASRSKDPSTQAGAVVVDQKNIVVGLGYNGWPRGVDINAFPWEREGDFLDTKYAYVCHGEENAVYNSNGSLEGCKIYCTLFPCNECAKTIIQNGIKEVVYESDKYHNDRTSIASRRLFDAAKVKYRQYISKLYSNNNKKSDKLIIGLAGEMGSGKSTAAKYFKDEYNADVFSFSGSLRAVTKTMAIIENRENLQNLSTILRREFGEDIMSQAILKKVSESKKSFIVVEAVRRIEDMACFKDFKNAIVFIDGGDLKNRSNRISKRSENIDDKKKTKEQLKKEQKKEAENKIKGLEKKADFVIKNTGSLSDFYKEIDRMIKDLFILKK